MESRIVFESAFETYSGTNPKLPMLAWPHPGLRLPGTKKIHSLIMKTFRLESEAWCLFVSFSAESLCIRPIFLQHLFHFFGVDLVMQDGDENTVNHLLIFAGLMPLHVLPIDMPPFWFLFSRPLQGSRPCRSNFILKNSQRNHRNNKPDLFSTSKLFSLFFCLSASTCTTSEM